ncbi:MAG: helix-turn-helix transcriptional regulator [Eggerthellaceae bacterium]|nr:helix-turn-helix transcriptional regulator [Eggerthellaceae bacterium]
MAVIWPSIHNQLLYPVTFSFNKSDAGSPYFFYLIYCLILFITIALVAITRNEEVTKGIFRSRYVMALFGILGCLGIFFLEVCDLSNILSFLLMGAGVGLSGMFVAIYFLFWSLQLIYASKKRVAFDLILSYLLFCFGRIIRLALDLHASYIAVALPLISAALAFYILTYYKGTLTSHFAFGKTIIKEMPLYFIIPAVLLVYVAAAMICILTPVDSVYHYPSSLRIIIYLSLAALMIILGLIYMPRFKIRRYADTISLGLVTLFLVGSVLTAGLVSVTDLSEEFKSFPVIAGLCAMEVYVWLLVLMNAQIKHTGIVFSAAVYLIGIIGVSHLANVIVAGNYDFSHFDFNELPILGITIVMAFVIVLVVNCVMAIMLYRAQALSSRQVMETPLYPQNQNTLPPDLAKPQEMLDGNSANAKSSKRKKHKPRKSHVNNDVPPQNNIPQMNDLLNQGYVPMTSDEVVLNRIKETFGLSNREYDTLCLAVRNKSAKEIASTLFVAESTVNSHLKGIYRICDVHSRKELIALVNQFRKEK